MSRGEILDAISGFADENFEEVKKMYEEKVSDSIAFAKYFTDQGFKNIRAFDIGLCACITRWCYTAGYIDRDYTWAVLEKNACKALEEYSSFSEFAKCYMAGRFFEYVSDINIHPDITEELYQILTSMKRLFNQKFGLWELNPWVEINL